MSLLRNFLNSRFIVISMTLALGGSVLYYIDYSLKEVEYQKRILSRNDTHERVLYQFKSSVDNFATLVSGIRSFVELSPKMPGQLELQRFVNTQLEQIEYNKEIIVSYVDSSHTFQYTFTRVDLNPAGLAGMSLRDIREDKFIKQLDQLLKTDGIQMFKPLNLREGWIGIPLNFRVKKQNQVIGHIGSLLNLKVVLDNIYSNIDSDEFVLHFLLDNGTAFDRRALYDGSQVYNKDNDDEYYKNFEVEPEDFVYKNVELYNQNFKIGIAFKKPFEEYTVVSYLFLGWFLALIGLIITLLLIQSNYVKQLNSKFERASDLLIAQKQQIADQNKKVTKDLKFVESITQLSPAHIYIFQLPKMIITYANRDVSEYLGYDKDKYPTATDLMRSQLHPEDLPKSKDRLKHFASLPDNVSMDTTLRVMNANGEYRWFLGKEVIFSRDEDGNPSQILGIADDITEIKEIELELAESEKKLKDAQILADIGYWEADMVNHQLEFSDQSAKILGIKTESEKNKLRNNSAYFREFVHPEDLELVLSKLRSGLRTKKNYGLDYRIINKNKRLKNIHSIVNMVSGNNGRVTKTWGTIQDITKRKRTEKLLVKQNKELERVNAELDRFIYGVTHDLKAPLSNIHGLMNLIKSENKKAVLTEYYSKIGDSTRKMREFIDESMNYTKNVNLEVKKEKISLKLLFEEIIEEHKYMKSAEKIEFDTKIESKQTIISDHSRVRVVINNLISNAIKYHDYEKKNPFVHIECYDSKDSTMIKVLDNGSGMDNTDSKKIFDMFYRTKSGASLASGSGIGLYILKETLDKIGGSISVESEVGIGTTFTISIPDS